MNKDAAIPATVNNGNLIIRISTLYKLIIGIFLVLFFERIAALYLYESNGLISAWVKIGSLNLISIFSDLLLLASILCALIIAEKLRKSSSPNLGWYWYSIFLIIILVNNQAGMFKLFRMEVKPSLINNIWLSSSWVVVYWLFFLGCCGVFLLMMKKNNFKTTLKIIALLGITVLGKTIDSGASTIIGSGEKVAQFYGAFIGDVIQFIGFSGLLILMLLSLNEKNITSSQLTDEKTGINPKLIAELLFKIIASIVIFHLLTVIYRYVFNIPGHEPYMFKFFNVDYERNLPTVYSTMALMACSMILFLVACIDKLSFSKYWSFLALIFFFLSLDERYQIHENLGRYFQSTHEVEAGIFMHTWIIVYMIFVVLVAIPCIKFLMALPRKIAKLFIISGSIFVVGAIGMEWLGGLIWVIGESNSNYGTLALYSIISTLEESLEMLGVALFICVLISYIKEHLKYNFIIIK